MSPYSTPADRLEEHPGYWQSPWPVECGGNRRQKAAPGRLDAASGTAEVTSRIDDRWNVMVIHRDAGEVYLSGTMPSFAGPPPHGWVEKIDPVTLEPIASSPELPCGSHVWCGAILAHRNGSLYNVNGSFLHRLDPDCGITGELELPVDRAHNGLLALSDGSLVTKDARIEGQDPSTLTRIDPETMEVLATISLPEPSMGRIAADRTMTTETVYVPGTHSLWRITIDGGTWEVDTSRNPRYRADHHGLAWDSCISGGSAWLMDNGDVPAVRAIFEQYPNGRFDAVTPGQLSWQQEAPWTGAQRLIRIDLDTGDVASSEPIGAPGGGIIAPPVHVPEFDVTVCWDSINGGLVGVDPATLEPRWSCDVRATMQPVVYPASGEMVINDFVFGDHLVVIDLEDGRIIDRVDLGSRVANGMFLSPGTDRDVYYCSTLTFARVAWR